MSLHQTGPIGACICRYLFILAPFTAEDSGIPEASYGFDHPGDMYYAHYTGKGYHMSLKPG